MHKLHIGCGDHIIEGWLNTDGHPWAAGVTKLDATQVFPFPDASFDYIYSEHMIEHVSFDSGSKMLSECFRVLRPGGHLRVCTPDLEFLVDLYKDAKTRLQVEYIEYALDNENDTPFHDEVFIINNFFRKWGHCFIYNERVLKAALQIAGFKDIKRCKLQESQHKDLAGLANDTRMPAGFLELETLTLEATKMPA